MISPMVGIGIIRFLLAFVVVLLHADLAAFEAAQIAVLTFFYLSGSLMERAYQRYSNGLRFLLNRILRLIPSFLVVGLATKTIVELASAEFRQAFAFIYLRPLLVYGSDNPVPLQSLLTMEWDAKIPYLGFESELVPQAWSIGNEFFYYLTVPLLAFLGRRLVFIVIAGSGAFLLIEILMRWIDFDYAIYTNLLATYFFFGSGYLVSRSMSKGGQRQVVILSRTLSIALILALPWIEFPERISPGMTIGYTALLAIALTVGFLRTPSFENGISQLLGKISYPIYLSHMITIGLLNYFSMLTIPFLLLTSTGLSLLLYFVIELPLERVRSKVRA